MIVDIKTLELNETNYNEIINLYNYFSINDKTILETWADLSLDPNSNKYIEDNPSSDEFEKNRGLVINFNKSNDYNKFKSKGLEFIYDCGGIMAITLIYANL